MPGPGAPLPPSSSKTLTRGRVVGDYEILGELGRGGMGVVYRARQISLNRVVALKMLTGHYGSDELTRFLAEAETAAGLHHTNIIQIYEVGEIEGAPFFSMEYVESGSLADRLRTGPLEGGAAAQLLISVARALHFAHRNGVVHRDMKPANILLDPEGVPKVADFGIAKRLTANSSLTLSGAVIGTPTYMAPEQAKGTSRDVGAQADVYSLGAILYEMLAGRPPFLPEDSETALTVRVITEDAVSPAFYRPGIPRDIETICLKCLEKNPRDRYESAAAFAEDLRRYLDDESIVARPPTTVVRTIKWIRRHPWRFVSRAALFGVAIAGVSWLYQWEFYQRAHIEYARTADFVNGALEPVTGQTKAMSARSVVSLRLTRRGRRGPVTLVEVLNPRGHPALIRRLHLAEQIPIYIEGITGTQPLSEKTVESSSVEFTYEGDKLREATARDRNGIVLWRVVYDRAASNEAARAHFVNVRGFDSQHATGATHMAFERDSAGRDQKVTFFNGAGQPTPNGEGVYGYKLDRNEAGWITLLTNIDAQGKPMANREGLTSYAYTFDKEGRIVRSEIRDADGKPSTTSGIAGLAIEYDKAGNASRVTSLGLDGKAARSNDFAVQEITSDSFGQFISRKYFKVDADEKLSLVGEWSASYDDRGYPREVKVTGSKPYRIALQYDDRGNLTEEKNLDADGHVAQSDQGYAIRRHTYKFGPEGTYSEQRYFDATGAKSYGNSGYHIQTSSYDSGGVLRRLTNEELDQTKYHYHRDVSLPEYDALGRPRRSVIRHENEKGELALDAGLLYAQQEETFDEKGRVFLIWELGCNVEIRGSPTLSIDLEWHKTGAEKRRVRQACDANRKPLDLTSNGIPARKEEEYDQLGRLERIFESGFNEQTHGYKTLEATFSDGALQKVVHKRSDGGVVEAVQVFIVALVPEQPKAKELRIGDQLVESNGVPVRNGYEWAAAPFPGGWLEVVRDGKRLRIEGFEAGALGVGLEDRAARN